MLGATAKIFATTTVLLASFTGLRADSHHEGPKTVGRDRGYGRLPLAFEPNQGQARADVRFISRADGYAVWATTTEAILVFGDPTAPLVRTSFVGANRATVVRGVDPLAGVSNYLIGNDRRQWHTGIPQFGRVRYDGIYPGVVHLVQSTWNGDRADADVHSSAARHVPILADRAEHRTRDRF